MRTVFPRDALTFLQINTQQTEPRCETAGVTRLLFSVISHQNFNMYVSSLPVCWLYSSSTLLNTLYSSVHEFGLGSPVWAAEHLLINSAVFSCRAQAAVHEAETTSPRSAQMRPHAEPRCRGQQPMCSGFDLLHPRILTAERGPDCRAGSWWGGRSLPAGNKSERFSAPSETDSWRRNVRPHFLKHTHVKQCCSLIKPVSGIFPDGFIQFRVLILFPTVCLQRFSLKWHNLPMKLKHQHFLLLLQMQQKWNIFQLTITVTETCSFHCVQQDSAATADCCLKGV